MPKVKANGITMNYEQQGAGEPLVLIPFLAADNACYAFQVADYAKHFTCVSVDLRGAGETDKPAGAYSMELFADDVAAFMRAIGVRATCSGCCSARPPDYGSPLNIPNWSSHRPFTAAGPKATRSSRPWSKAGSIAKGLGSVTEMVVQGIFHVHAGTLCGQAGLYRPQLAAFVRSRPKQPFDAFIQQSNAVIAHDAAAQLGRVKAPTQITFGRHDMVTSTRFADAMKSGIKESELLVFETCAHAPMATKAWPSSTRKH